MIKRAPFGGVKAVLGCGIIFIILSGIVGIILSFFADDPALASLIRKRCIAGILLCIVIIVLVKVIRADDDF
jgi:hypothetical protein